MAESRATDKAARYMTQLAKHWGHKFETRLTPEDAEIALPIGVCQMQASPDRLAVVVEAEDPASLPRLEQVVADHLARFAFREPDLKLEWAPGPA